MNEQAPVRTGQLIMVPALITLGVALLRLAGELQGWSPRLFNKAAGGGGALVGIAWLVVVFGAWFGWKLGRSGADPGPWSRTFGLAFVGLAILPILGVATAALGMNQQSLGTFAVIVVGSLAGLLVGLRAWPALGRALLAYAFAARVPVLIVMLLAIDGNWGTHYDVAPPGLPEMGTLAKWFLIGVVPQMTFWIWFTVVGGSLFGIGAGVLSRRGRAAA